MSLRVWETISCLLAIFFRQTDQVLAKSHCETCQDFPFSADERVPIDLHHKSTFLQPPMQSTALNTSYFIQFTEIRRAVPKLNLTHTKMASFGIGNIDKDINFFTFANLRTAGPKASGYNSLQCRQINCSTLLAHKLWQHKVKAPCKISMCIQS